MLLLWIPLLGMLILYECILCTIVFFFIITETEKLFLLCSLSFSRGGLEANQNLRDQFSSAVSTALEDADAANNNLLTSIDSQYLYACIWIPEM